MPITLSGEPAKKDSAESLAIEIAESQPDMSVDQIVDQVSIRLKDTAFSAEELKTKIKSYREAHFEAENELYQKMLRPFQNAFRMLVRRGVINPDAEMSFMSQAGQNEEEIKAKIQAAEQEKRSDQSLEILVELANAPDYGQSEEDIAVDSPHADYETVSKVKKLSPKLFTYQRPVDKETKEKTTKLEEILAVNPELSVNQVINILDSFIEEKMALDGEIQELQKQLNEFVEKYEKWKADFKKRFDAMSELHPGISWELVETSLDKDHSASLKLMKLDAAGFEMNVFKSKDPTEIIFRAAQLDVTKIDAKYRTIMYDSQAEKDYPQYKVNGNAEEIAVSLGVELADPELYEQLRVGIGWFWLGTDAATRKNGRAFFGNYDGIHTNYTNPLNDRGSFCASLRVKKT